MKIEGGRHLECVDQGPRQDLLGYGLLGMGCIKLEN